ncbi:MAG: polyphosphate:AMP phosphotransferase [Candidatus Tectomicrobia bacterium]|nr:polyphosphate:AMP phosphotransferase [Candidatus Tectomicrobia bacterium]
MFESAELGHKIDKETYKKEAPELREALLNTQLDIVEAGAFPVIILVGGVDGAGKGETVNLLNEWMDPRHIQAHAMGAPSDEERERPAMWRFWHALPPKGKVGIFFGSWYTDPIVDRVIGKTKTAQLDQSIDEINRFEKMLADEGALIVKFWFHLSKESQRKRLKALEKNPETRWRVTDTDWERFKIYDTFRKFSEYTLRQTSTAEAPWIVVEGLDPRYRSLTVGKVLLEAMRKRLDQKKAKEPVVSAAPLLPQIDNLNVLKSLNLSQGLPKDGYTQELEHYQGRLNLLTRDPKFKKMSLIVAFEGNDAAGKGGGIRRITSALDARHYTIIPVAAPTEEERVQPYLWRFWRHIPRLGRVTIFDRTWYGRVLVERVEGFCSESDWMRAYSEINDFEAQLVRHNIAIVKFWLSISKEEQLRRFEEREKTGFKRFKITEEDWRNREKWDIYERAVCDMVDRTSTEIAPWTLVEANDKYFARIKVLKTLCERIEAVL